jgi:chromosome segregation ATPase
MSSNNKRQVKKKLFSKNEIASKKVSTGDKNEQEYISQNFDNGICIKTTKKLLEVEITENLEDEQRQRIAELQEKNSQLEDQLKSLSSQYESEKVGIVQDVNKYNDAIKQKSEEVNEVSKENNKLMKRLKNIENNLNDKYSKFMEKKIVKKKKNIQRTEKTVKKEVDVKEEQIKNIKKKIEAEKTQRMKAENLLNEVNDGLEENHKNYIKELDEKIKVAKNEVKKLSEVRVAHEHCIKEIQSLTSQLNLVHNEIEFETKKNDMIMSTINNDIDTNTNNTNINEEKKDILSIKLDNELVKNKNDYGFKVRDLILKTKTPRRDKINKSAFNYIKNEFDIIKKKVVPSTKKSIVGNLNEVTSVIDTSSVQTNLFTEKETDLLKN